MKAIYKGAVIGSALMVASSAAAQSTSSAYFTDNYTYGYQLNPAFANDKNFVSLPALGNLNVGFRGDLDLRNVIYNRNGRTVLFTNPGVTAADVLDGMGANNRLIANVKENILNVGFKGLGGYNTIGISAVANVGVRVPRTFFEMVKEDIVNRTYDVTDFSANANAYAEIALGHSRQINSRLRVGATLKVLLGVANFDADLNNAYLTLGEDGWYGVTNADIYASMKGLTYKHKYNDDAKREYVNGIDTDGFGLSGFGVGVDLGAVYTLNKDWEFSAAVLDLGVLSYSNTRLASTNGDQQVWTDDYVFNVDSDAPNSFDNEVDRLSADLSRLYQLSDMGAAGNRTKALATTLNFGAKYTLPAYRKLNFGLMNTTRIYGNYSWTQFRLSANVNPVKCLSANVNVAAGTFGMSFGWLLNISTTGFNLFVGMDHTPGKLAKQGVPLSSNGQFNFGIDFPF